MHSEIFFLVEESPEGYIARALGESLFTQADAVRCPFSRADSRRIA